MQHLVGDAKGTESMNRLRMLVLFLVPVIQAQALVACAGTIGYWSFENGVVNTNASGQGSVLDGSGNGRNGTPLSNPVYRQSIPGTNRVAMEFTSGNQRVFFQDEAAFAITGSMTIEATIRFDGFPATNHWGLAQIFFRGDNRGGNDPYYFAVDSSRRLNFMIQGFPGLHSAVYSVVKSDPLELGRWYRIAAMLDDSNGRQSVFIDGVEVAHTITNLRPMANLDPNSIPGVSIGNLQSTTWFQAFGGLIDEVRLKNIAELTPAQPVPEPSSFCILSLMCSLYAMKRRRNVRLHPAR